MKKDPKDNKLSLSVEDIGSEIEDAKVTCIKVFCPRKANNFVSFLCDGRFTVAGKSKVDIVEGGSYIISGKVTEWNNRPQVTLKKISVDDFSTLRVIGKGSYGKVLLVEKKDDKKIYAMKILKKKAMIKRNQVTHIKTERRIMELIDHPFIVKLRYAFQTPQKLYFIMDYCPGGELFFHIQKVERFNEDAVKFYGAQIALALDHLHKNNIIYRE